MNKLLLLASFLFFAFSSCQKQEKIQLPANKVYVMATYFSMPNYDDEGADFDFYKLLRTRGVAEVSQDMKAKVIRPSNMYFSGTDFFSADICLSDSLKKSLVQLVEECQQDTIYRAECYIPEIYDGPSFFILIEKENEERILVGAERYSEPPQYVSDVLNILKSDFYEIEHRNIVNLEYEEAIKIFDKKSRLYSSSLMAETGIFPSPPPLRRIVKFVPPVIEDEE